VEEYNETGQTSVKVAERELFSSFQIPLGSFGSFFLNVRRPNTHSHHILTNILQPLDSTCYIYTVQLSYMFGISNFEVQAI
jgi:hypothetical protein